MSYYIKDVTTGKLMTKAMPKRIMKNAVISGIFDDEDEVFTIVYHYHLGGGKEKHPVRHTIGTIGSLKAKYEAELS